MSATDVLAQIEAKLGFVPPFFEPAAEHPELLQLLWVQTEMAYLNNALPALFKEKVAAVLGRYCEVPYCLVCHTCSLRPLGLNGPQVVALLSGQHPTDEQVDDVLQRWQRESSPVSCSELSAQNEQDLFCLASAVYHAGPLAHRARTALRERLSGTDYRNLIVFISYNKMCHDWMAAHPEVSYELDQRYVQNYAALAAESPGMTTLFARPTTDTAARERVEATVAERSAEAEQSFAISELRTNDVIAQLNRRVNAAVQNATRLDSMAQELRHTAEFAQELLAIVSHDLRNPLGNVLLGAEMIMRLDLDNTKVAAPLQRMVSSARRAERLVHDLLDFSQARAGGGIPIDLQPTDLRLVLRGACEDFTRPDRSIVLEHVGDTRGEWSAERLAQIVANLLGNALSHGKKQTPILLSTDGDAQSIRISVHNENLAGPIPAELLPILFDPFKRGVTRKGNARRSVGLGLYIVQELARGHRGRVEVSSTEAGGTTFTVLLPRHASSPSLL